MLNKTTTLTIEELKEKYKNFTFPTDSEISDEPLLPLLPIAKRIAATTIANGGWRKSEKQQLREDRANKLLKIKGEEPNVVLENDEYVDGIIQVIPAYTPYSQLFYIDYK